MYFLAFEPAIIIWANETVRVLPVLQNSCPEGQG